MFHFHKSGPTEASRRWGMRGPGVGEGGAAPGEIRANTIHGRTSVKQNSLGEIHPVDHFIDL